MSSITSVSPSGVVSPDQLAAPSTASTSLNASDFLNLMVTELQNQDPTQPTSNEDLLQQMSEIGQMESSTSLQSTLTSMATQNQIGAASSLIGKSVQGTDANSNPLSGNVTSVQVSTSGVSLSLDSGGTLSLANVTNIAPGPTAATTTTTTGS